LRPCHQTPSGLSECEALVIALRTRINRLLTDRCGTIDGPIRHCAEEADR
jgi:hypothetical protein